jgi:hypothetical protein
MQIVISGIIIAASFALFAYWFRYSCLLILSAQTTQDYAGVVAKASGLSVLEMQEQLEAGGSFDLSTVHRAMEADFAAVRRMLDQAPGIEEHLTSSEQFVLRLDYHLMRAWARLTARSSPEQARQALLEQCAIVSHFANAAGCAGVLRG